MDNQQRMTDERRKEIQQMIAMADKDDALMADFAMYEAELHRLEQALEHIWAEGWHHNDPWRIWDYAKRALTRAKGE